MSKDAPSQVRDWISFEDPEEDRTWLFDITFLESSWQCIFGAGCQGVYETPAPERVEGCCSYGAHFTDDDDVARVAAAAARLTPSSWQHFAKAQRGGFLARRSGERTTRLVDGACIFLNRPGFVTGPGCALHQAAVRDGVAPMTAKPDVCWQLPLRREDLVEDGGHVVSRVSAWQRRHWGEAGDDFAWWCTESPEAFRGSRPVYLELEDELVGLVGAPIYTLLRRCLEERTTRLDPPRRRR